MSCGLRSAKGKTMKSRVISGAIAVVYLGFAAYAGGGAAVMRFVIFLVFPLACIWFSEEMGSYTGMMRGHMITTETPRCLVAFFGWVLLLLPVIVGAVVLIRSMM